MRSEKEGHVSEKQGRLVLAQEHGGSSGICTASFLKRESRTRVHVRNINKTFSFPLLE